MRGSVERVGNMVTLKVSSAHGQLVHWADFDVSELRAALRCEHISGRKFTEFGEIIEDDAEGEVHICKKCDELFICRNRN